MCGFKGEPRAAQMGMRRCGTNDGPNDFLCRIQEGRRDESEKEIDDQRSAKLYTELYTGVFW